MFSSLAQNERFKIAHLFKNHRSSILIDSILEGHLGIVIVDNSDNPTMAQLTYADIIVYGGNAKHPSVGNFIKDLPINKAILPMPQDWNEAIRKSHGDKITTFKRFSFYTKYLDLINLRNIVQRLPSEFEIKRLDIELAKKVILPENSEYQDHIKNFPSVEYFIDNGLGFCVTSKSGKIISISSSYAFSNQGIEVQVNTHPDFRNRGLALVVCAASISHCLDNDIEPHWSTINMESRRLAERLGYKYKDTYEVLVRTQ